MSAPAVWVGCLACYNAGRLVGQWHDAATADEVTPDDVHGRPTSHEELWCFDHEHLGIRGECSPVEATERARAILAAMSETDAPLGAVLAYLDDDADADLAHFADAYRGQWGSLADYAQDLYADAVAGFPMMARYIAWERVARDLTCDGWHTTPTGDGDVYVFAPV